MALLRRLNDGLEIAVPAVCIAGRAASSTLVLDDAYASSQHAKLVWSGTRWMIRDLGSRNGTFVDGARIEPGAPVPIKRGSRIGFGETNAAYELIDDTVPGIIAVDTESRAVKTASTPFLLLPSDDAPEVSIYPDTAGTEWIAEHSNGAVRKISDGDIVRAGSQSFRVQLPVLSEATPIVQVAMSVENITVRFQRLPRNELRVSISHRGRETVLESREHHNLLLAMAELRAQDAGLDEGDRGWRTLEQISKIVRQEINAINVATHRARQQFAQLGIENAAQIIESRTGIRRFGAKHFEIVRSD